LKEEINYYGIDRKRFYTRPPAQNTNDTWTCCGVTLKPYFLLITLTALNIVYTKF